MPSINITETDNTIYNLATNTTDNVVYVPGSAITGPYEAPVLLNSLDSFKNTFGSVGVEGSPTWDYVSGLLIAGLPVLFRRIAGKNMDTGSPEIEVVPASTIISASVGDPDPTSKQMLKVSEKYGGTYGNTMYVTVEILASAVNLKIYKDANLIESVRLISKTEEDNDETIRPKLIDAINKTEFNTVKLEILDEENFVLPATQRQQLTGGTDMPEADVREEVSKTYEYIKDKYVYDVKFLTSGGYTDAESSQTTIANAMIALAEERRDCIAIVDIPLGTPKENVTSFFANIDTSYAAAYAPWCYTRLPNKSEKWMAPSYIFLYTLGRSLSSGNPLWVAPAGVQRASVPQIIRPEYEIGGDIMEDWQNTNPQSINPIMKIRSYGYVIYGQRTLYNMENQGDSQTSALQELTVRIVANEIKRQIFLISLQLTFNSNNIRTWNEFRGLLDPYLAQIKADRGISDYQIIMDESTVTDADVSTNTIRGIVRISVSRAAENFEIDFQLESSGVQFAEEDEELNI